MLLWRGLTGEAEAMLPLVDADWQGLGRGPHRRPPRRGGAAVPDQPGAGALEGRPRPRLRALSLPDQKGRWQEAEDYLLQKSTSAEALGRPDLWMERRANLARQALEDGRCRSLRDRRAELRHAGADYADAEWVAGYIALTRLDDPEGAAGHFARFRAAVASPISLGRAGYWLGRA